MVRDETLKITEIFHSIQGESKTVGIPTVFVRLTGCPLRCQYCDTAYAFHGGHRLSISEILLRVASFNTRYVTVTGGEPLAQLQCLALLKKLADANYIVSLETSGALDISKVDPRVIKVMDLKTPGSKEESRNLYQNLEYLLPHDQVKFVICNRFDYEWAKQKVSELKLSDRCEVLFSPSYQEMTNEDLANWILEDHLPVRFQIQLHKYIWGDVVGK